MDDFYSDIRHPKISNHWKALCPDKKKKQKNVRVKLKLTCGECDAKYDTEPSDSNDIINTRRSNHQSWNAFIYSITLCM